MSKLLFRPVAIVSGLLAGIIGRKAFALIWRAVDDHQPPQPENRRASLGKLALALSLQGAVFSVVKGLVDHASRQGFARFTGSWPGDEQDENAESEPS
jgi:hypothetical protein